MRLKIFKDNIVASSEINKDSVSKNEIKKDTINELSKFSIEINKFTRTLKLWTRWDDVRELQEFLTNKWFDTKGIEWIFGYGTKKALIKFQETIYWKNHKWVDWIMSFRWGTMKTIIKEVNWKNITSNSRTKLIKNVNNNNKDKNLSENTNNKDNLTKIEKYRLSNFRNIVSKYKEKYSDIDLKNIFNGKKEPTNKEIRRIRWLVNSINITWNRMIKYVSDSKNKQIIKSSNTSYDAILTNSWDCEEFAWIKLQMLKEIWIPEKYLSLGYWKQVKSNISHMVLNVALAFSNEKVILDNNTINMYFEGSNIHKASFKEIYSFNKNVTYNSKWKKINNNFLPKIYASVLDDRHLFA